MDFATQNIFSVTKYALKFHTDIYYQTNINYLAKEIFTRRHDHLFPFNLKITYKQEKENSLSNPFQKSYYLTFHFTGHISSEMMKDMPSFASIVTIREVSDPTGITSNSPSYAEITAIENCGMDHSTYHLNKKEEVIFLLIDSKGRNTPPWTLLDEHNRLYYHGSYPYMIYHDQSFYENILIKNGCNITHVSHKLSEGYTFSEIIIIKTGIRPSSL